MPQQIVYDDSKREYVLEALDRKVDDDGYIIYADSEERVEATDGEPIKVEDVGYIAHGSTEFVRDDLTQLREYFADSA